MVCEAFDTHKISQIVLEGLNKKVAVFLPPNPSPTS